MRKTLIGFAGILGVLAGSMLAQQKGAPAAPKTFTSAADITAMMAKAKNERKQDQANFTQQVLSLAPYNANMEYRSGAVAQAAATHMKEAEMFFVIDGSGTLVTGGKLVEETKQDPDNPRGTSIEGGTSKDIAKGDYFIVPEGTPHWFSKINGTLVLMSLHVPRTAGK